MSSSINDRFLEARILYDQKRRVTSRRSLRKGGAISVADARKKRDDRDTKEHNDAVRKAQTAIDRYVNKAKKELKARGIQAHKDERDRKKSYQEFLARGEELPIGIEIPIHDLEKNSRNADREARLPHPSLLQARDALLSGPRPRIVLGPEGIEEVLETEVGADPGETRPEPGLEPGGDDDGDDEMEMVTEVVEEEPGRVDLKDSSGSEDELSDTPLADHLLQLRVLRTIQLLEMQISLHLVRFWMQFRQLRVV
ncbi:hypothetical protein MMC07_009445 [Pseudocyphellaria aurata]|nr:hypothetical protein [Pseudocyphellaria aurata]